VSKQKAKVIVLSLALPLIAFMGFVRPAFLAMPVSAKPAFMDRYNRDEYSKVELHGKCTVCHIGHGGGERNDFGEAFEDMGYRITPKLRAKFPDLFDQKLPANQAK